MKKARLDEVLPVRLPRTHKIALRRIARKQGCDASAIVRELIEQRIDQEAQASDPQVGDAASADRAQDSQAQTDDVGAAA